MVSLKANQNAASNSQIRSSRINIFARFIRFVKFGRRLIYQFFTHCLDAFFDLSHYLRYSNSFYRSGNDRQKLQALLFFYYHKIEKSLALPEIKPIFGLGYMNDLLDLMEQWFKITGQCDAVVFRGAYDAVTCYREHVGDTLDQQKPELGRRIDALLLKFKPEKDGLCHGGTINLAIEELMPASQSIDFEQFVSQRHSVRNFTNRHIPDNILYRAVKSAQKSPSVCNRQCARVHVFTTAADKAQVLQYQNGNTGFGHLADRVLLITADLRVFLTSGERNQAYIDAGMFAMTLLYALQAQGISSCCLNLSHSFVEERAFRRASKIPQTEVPVMLIAVGYPPESLKVAVSARVPTEAVLSFRNFDAEAQK